MKPSCLNCAFVHEEYGYRDFPIRRCRRNPPTVVVRNSHDIQYEWPIVDIHDWCGEFKNKFLEYPYLKREN